MSINKVIITGNLTRDPELRATGSGMNVLKLGVAVNDRRKNQSTGEWEEVPKLRGRHSVRKSCRAALPVPLERLTSGDRGEAPLEPVGDSPG